MISRIWHGWTKPEHADEYESMLRADVLPGIHRVAGYQGAYLLRRSDGDQVAFVTITMFDDMDAVRRFAGDDYTRAVVPPAARRILTRFDERSVHYETILTPADVRRLAGQRSQDADATGA
jgi:heme-degrading monooxygenase HmoA